MSVRSDFEAELTEAWADIPALASVRVIATERPLDDIQRPTALIRQQSIARTPTVPNSHRTVTLLLTLISPHLDLDKAADQLDELVGAALDYISPRYSHGEAELADYGKRLAYDIHVPIIAHK